MTLASLLARLRRLVRHDEGQDLTEYGLLMLLIAVVAISSVQTLGDFVLARLWEPARTLAVEIAGLI